MDREWNSDELLWETVEWFDRHGGRYRRRGWDIGFLSNYISGDAVDMGSGSAATSLRLLRQGLIKRLVLVDLSPRMLVEAGDSVFAVKIVGDMRNGFLRENSFDTCLMIASLHNIPGRDRRLGVLKNAYRLLRCGGHLVVFVWSRWQIGFLPVILRHLPYWFAGGLEWGDVVLRDKSGRRYYHLYTAGELRKDIATAGFHVVAEGVFYPRRKLFGRTKNHYIIAMKTCR